MPININQAGAFSTLASSTYSLVPNKAISRTTILASPANGAIPTGSVVVNLTPISGGSTITSAPLTVQPNGTVVWPTTIPTVGNYTATASYSGSGSYLPALVTAPAVITVTSTANYSVSAINPIVGVSNSDLNSVTNTIYISPFNMYFGNVTMSCSGLPAGATCSFLPSTVNVPTPRGLGIAQPSVPTTLTITASSGTPAGSYPVTVTGKSGSLFNSYRVILNVAQ